MLNLSLHFDVCINIHKYHDTQNAAFLVISS